MSKNDAPTAFLEGTPAEQQRAAFDYLRERSRMAHNEGDGLLANHLSIVALNEATKLLKTGECHLSLRDLRWAYILAHYWLIDGYLLDSEIKEALACAPQTDGTDRNLLDLLRLYSKLIKEPLWSDPKELLILQHPQCEWMSGEGVPEDLALVEHLVELLWFRDPQGDSWGKVIDAWTAAPNAALKCTRLLAQLKQRLSLQSSLTIPGSLYPPLRLEDAEKWASDPSLVELWIQALHGNRAGVDAAVTRRLPYVSDDVVQLRQLLDFQHLTRAGGKDLDPQAVRLTRRRLFDNALLRFEETREECLAGALGRIFQKDEKGLAYERRNGFRLAMLCEISSLRQWDFGGWLEAVRAQSTAALEVARWEDIAIVFARNGLLLAVLSLIYDRGERLVRGGLKALEFAGADVREHLVRNVLFCYPLQGYDAIHFLSDLSDAIPEHMWPEVANWCRGFLDEGWNSEDKSRGASALPLAFWAKMFPFLASSSSLWRKLAPIMELEAKDPMNWITDDRGFFLRYLLYAPVEMARDAGRAMIDLRLGDSESRERRFDILREACEQRKVLADELAPELERLAETRLQKWRLKAKPLGSGASPAEERAAKEHLREELVNLVRRISPGGTQQYLPQIDCAAYACLQWTVEESDSLLLVLQTIENPGTLKLAIHNLLDTLRMLVAGGPPQFAERVHQPFIGWLRVLPTWREIPRPPVGGPLSIVNAQGTEEGLIEDALAGLAYELRSRLGAELDDAISRWVLDTSIRSDLVPASNVMRLALALAASIQIGSNSAVDADKANMVRREALLDACRAMLSSFWHQYREDASRVADLVWALRGLRHACRKEGPAEMSWESPNSAFVGAILTRMSALMARLTACPHADVRAEVARTLRNFSSWCSLPPDLQERLAGLSSDARARVRQAARADQ
jgi:hypothetical protein